MAIRVSTFGDRDKRQDFLCLSYLKLFPIRPFTNGVGPRILQSNPTEKDPHHSKHRSVQDRRVTEDRSVIVLDLTGRRTTVFLEKTRRPFDLGHLQTANPLAMSFIVCASEILLLFAHSTQVFETIKSDRTKVTPASGTAPVPVTGTVPVPYRYTTVAEC